MSEEEKLQLENECLLKYSKAQMIQKYIDELEENCTLSDLWYKSQEENKRLNNIINELEKYINETKLEKYINETKLEEFEKEYGRRYGRRYGKTFTQAEVIICNMILNRLQELKGSGSNE